MINHKNLITNSLVLRPYVMADASRVAELANDPAVAENIFIPHPYTLEDAKTWIESHKEKKESNTTIHWAQTLKKTGELIGTVTLRLFLEHDRGEVAYWLGQSYWGKGYTVEAVEAVLAFGFSELGLHRIEATHMTKNKASGRVLQKVGMLHEGTLRQYFKKNGSHQDTEIYSILSS